jgi:Polyketide synthase modules and related proteins
LEANGGHKGALFEGHCFSHNSFSHPGPSFTIDNSWTGGIEVLRQAVQDISEGRVDTAIVGVSNLLLNANLNSLFQGLNRLSPDGKTRSFDHLGKSTKETLLSRHVT